MNQMEGAIEPIAKVASVAVVVSVGELPSMTGKTYVIGELDWTAHRPFREGDVAVVVQSSFPLGVGLDARLELWSDDSWRVRLRVFNALGRALPAGRHAASIEVYAESDVGLQASDVSGALPPNPRVTVEEKVEP